eukprot:337596_1
MNEWLYTLCLIGTHHERNPFLMFQIQQTRPHVTAVLWCSDDHVTLSFIITPNVQQKQKQKQKQHTQHTQQSNQSKPQTIAITNTNTNTDTNTNMNSNVNNNTNTQAANEGILTSPLNPATRRRLSKTDSSYHEVSWHKRVVVHRVPRSDASRSMFHPKSKESNHSNQCCTLL